MNFYGIMENIIAFFQGNIIISIVVAVILLYILYRSPKLFIIILGTGLLLTGIFYVISDVATTGSDQKKKIIREYSDP